MKRVSLKPSILDLLQIDNLNRQLERQDATMSIVQKALGEYLERQRQIFPVTQDLQFDLFYVIIIY
jgi:dynein heavy chain 1